MLIGELPMTYLMSASLGKETSDYLMTTLFETALCNGNLGMMCVYFSVCFFWRGLR
jgi:hypothetical protein